MTVACTPSFCSTSHKPGTIRAAGRAIFCGYPATNTTQEDEGSREKTQYSDVDSWVLGLPDRHLLDVLDGKHISDPLFDAEYIPTSAEFSDGEVHVAYMYRRAVSRSDRAICSFTVTDISLGFAAFRPCDTVYPGVITQR